MKTLRTIGVGIAFALVSASPALALDLDTGVRANAKAETGVVNATVDANIEARITKGKDRAEQEINRRVKALSELSARIKAMVRLTLDAKASIDAGIQSQVSALNVLKTKIEADTDIETLKADIKSITGSYRIFLLVIPQGHILVAADKLKFVATNATTLAAKISARIDAAAAAGHDVSTLKTALADMQAKIADANVQADAAIDLVADLKPDNGDKVKQSANEQALKDARVKIKAGMQSIVQVRKDAHTLVETLADFDLESHTETHTETSIQ